MLSAAIGLSALRLLLAISTLAMIPMTAAIIRDNQIYALAEDTA